MFKSERMQQILSMALDRKRAIEKLESQGESLIDGFICHLCKVILWYNLEDSWYNTLGKEIRHLSEIRMKPNNSKISRDMFIEYLFDPHCETKEEFGNTLLMVQAEFEDEIGSNGFQYPKVRTYNLDKVWKGFLGFREEILNRIEEKDSLKMIQSLKKDEIKKLCEKFFKKVI